MRAFLLMAAIGAVLPVGGCGKGGKGQGKSGDDASVPSPAKLAKHKYWDVPMTAAKVEAIVTLVLKQDRGSIVTVDENGQVEEFPHGDSATVKRQWIETFGNQRRVVFDTRQYSVRPSREKVLADFAEKLDRAEYQPRRKQEKDD